MGHEGNYQPPTVIEISQSGSDTFLGRKEFYQCSRGLLLHFALTFFNHCEWIYRGLLRIDIAREIAKGDYLERVRVQIAHELLEMLRRRVHPRMLAIWYAVELQHCDS